MGRASQRAWGVAIVAAALLGGACFGSRARAQSAEHAPAAVGDAGVADAPAGENTQAGGHDAAPAADPAAAVDPRIEELRAKARQIEALMAGALATPTEPASLFDVSLADEDAIRVEVKRLSAIVDQALAEAAPPPAAVEARPGRRGGKRGVLRSDPERAVVPDAGPADTPHAPIPALFDARLALDRARLAFYTLPEQRRSELLATHTARQHAEIEKKAAAQLGDAERRVRAADQERELALEAARKARTEAERLVAEENARLLGVSSAQAAFEADLARTRQALDQRAERTLRLQRRVREVRDERARGREVDGLYVELRTWLRASRDELDHALAALMSAASRVPDPLNDRLANMAVEVDREAVTKMHARLSAAAHELRELEQRARRRRAEQLFDEVRALNRDRLALLPYLSASMRDAVTGFGAAGFDQAMAELRQVSLVLRYRLASAQAWLSAIQQSNVERGRSAALVIFVLLKWLLLVLAFIWWRRRAEPFLTRWRERVREEDRRARAMEPSGSYGFLGFLLRVRAPLEWLLLVWLLVWLLPHEAADLLEVDLFTIASTWMLGGSLAVSTIDALAGNEAVYRSGRSYPPPSAGTRLESLRLIGRTVVAFSLILALSSRLVGEGTIYSWVFSTCWFAAIPVALLIVSWWRETIFERIDLVRKKRRFEQWVIENRQGWKSFPSAVAGGAYLFAQGSARAIRTWVGRFDLTRRLLAYLFRRGLDRLAEERTHLSFEPLPAGVFAALGPEVGSDALVAGGSDIEIEAAIERVGRSAGGVFAVIGERGAGKTTVLGRVRDALPEIVLVDCPEQGLDALRLALSRALGQGDAASLGRCGELLNEKGSAAAVLVDNAQRLIQPVMGGLDDFDHLVAVARANSTQCAWFFAVDEVIWRFFERARGARPLFDEVIGLEPWSEEEIAALLTVRSAQAAIAPRFDHLLETLPSDADEIDHAEALERAAAGYYRLIWDYSAGDPGVALHMWRRSLGLDPEGQVCVRLFQAPDTRDLERLPDPAVFVLRAVIQLEPARPEDVAQATMLRSGQVEDALRYGIAHGYLERVGARYRVTWTWFRAITRFLQRRHLLATHR